MAALFGAAPLQASDGAAPVAVKPVMELFTSQGCSSCPPADRLLGEYAKRKDVIVLTMPVQIWDYLGWHDTLAKPEFTARQRGYSARHKVGYVYTPQLVVGGVTHVAGGSKNKVAAAVERARRELAGSGVLITVAGDEKQMRVGIGAAPAAARARRGSIWLATVSRAEDVSILAGENRGRKIRYTNVVRSLREIGTWTGEAKELVVNAGQLSNGQDGVTSDGCVVMLQAGENGPIIGAAELWMRPGS